jgi:DNA-directed RNA polymerase subunit RPC12/RpoP
LKLSEHQRKVFRDIKNCRSSVLGEHLYVCSHCGEPVVLYNSCRNRNCPVCQGNKRRRWVEKRCADLLNVPYYHVVFTLPDCLNGLFLYRMQPLINVLFTSVWRTIAAFFNDPRFLGGKGGMLAVLHTWGQTLTLHPHLHCIVPGAGIDRQGNFKLIKGKDKYLFPVTALSLKFRGVFAAELTKQSKLLGFEIPQVVRQMMFRKNWVVYCKRPFGNAEAVVKYLGRYTYRTAISSQRIISDDDGRITFSFKNYAKQGKNELMALEAEEFFRRLAMHYLPRKTVRIRYYGMMSNCNRKKFVEQGATVVGRHKLAKDQTASENSQAPQIECPKCKTGHLQKVCLIPAEYFSLNFVIINQRTSDVVLHNRAGPLSEIVKILVSI